MSLVKPIQVLLTFAVVTCLPVVAWGQTTWHVDAAVPTGGDGLTWPTAFNDLQDALAMAVAGDQIWVAAGTYKPSDLPFALRTATFQLVDGVAMYGAFPPGGGDGTFGARDVTNPANETILSGDIGNQADAADNAYHVVTAAGVGNATILDGFTITNGNGDGDAGLGFDRGGGMYNTSSFVIVRDCAFRNNTAVSGAGICNSNGSASSVFECTFTTNVATGAGGTGGGGMCNFDSNPIVTSCVFTANSAARNGGGMYNPSSAPTVTGCTFSQNTASTGGGIANENSSPTINLCMFEGNSCTSRGGGLYAAAGGTKVDNCAFIGNSGASFGGGIFKINGGITVTNSAFISNSAALAGGLGINAGTGSATNCTFIDNTATAGSGGGMVGGGLTTTTGCTFVGNMASGNGGGLLTGGSVTNCMFSGNFADGRGGGLYGSAGTWDLTVTNCSFAACSAGDSGGAFVAASGLINLRNSVLWMNAATTGQELAILSGAQLIVSYTDVEGGLAAIHAEPGAIVSWGAGIIDTGPLFLGGPAGMWTGNATYDGATSQTTFLDAAVGLADDALVGKFLNPDAAQTLQSLIVANTATTITVWGDFASVGVLGATYQVNDYRLTPASPCVDAGDDFSVPADVADLDGDGNTTERTPLDLDLKPRFADSPPPGGTGVADPPIYPEIVDMGAYEVAPDCNNNGILDPCDLDCGVLGGPCDVPGCGLSADCNANGIPDDCEPQTDCQPNGVLDFCDIAMGTSPDCNGNGVPDECELTGNDCNANGVPDDCEPQDDCQPNGVQDICDIAVGTSLDCQPNGIPDECELVGNDCNTNNVPDECDPDTDNDGVIDDCDNCPLVFNPGQTDIDGDGVADLCDNCPNIPNPGQEDANGDGIGDVCPCPERGDMNDDGLVDGNDIQLFVEKLLGG